MISPFIDSYMAARSTKDLESRPSSPTGCNIVTRTEEAQPTEEMDFCACLLETNARG